MLRHAEANSPMNRSRILASLLLVAGGTAALWWFRTPAYSEACLETNHNLVICAASNMARFTQDEPLLLEHADFDLRSPSVPTVRLIAARNESVGMQFILRRTGTNAPAIVDYTLDAWLPAGNNQTTLDFGIQSSVYVAHYHWIENGDYTWGPKSQVRKRRAAYPDALVPAQHGCMTNTMQLFNSIPIPKHTNQNQAVWIDHYIAPDTAPGTYILPIHFKVDQQTVSIQVELSVVDALLPDKPSIDAIGEVYRSYNLEGAGTDRSTAAWQHMSHCYHQLAHKHRMVFIERTDDLPNADGWRDYVNAMDPILNGELFSEQYGYSGTGMHTPVSVWRTPWPQEYNIQLERPLTVQDLDRYRIMAKQWQQLASDKQWNATQFFAYVFDEVDGPNKAGIPDDQYRRYLAMVHDQMGLLQNALDAGSTNKKLDLLWTSHSNPADWADDPALDLSYKVRLWSPNASAADPDFLQHRIAKGDTVWFYHSGHPAVGAHSINAHGVDMRTWGVIGARYNIQGQLMWAVNLGADEKPFAQPSYKPDEDRFGNGVMVYPGNQLDKIGYKKSPGPIPSMRLKTWRRGLQDAELYYLAKAVDQNASDQLLHQFMPVALADATGKAAWSFEPADWIEFRKALLNIIAGVTTH